MTVAVPVENKAEAVAATEVHQNQDQKQLEKPVQAEKSPEELAAIRAARKADKDAKKKAAVAAAAKNAVPKNDPNQPLFSRLDMRVGQIISCEPHPDSEKLWVLQLDVGDVSTSSGESVTEPRQILTGLRENYTKEEMLYSNSSEDKQPRKVLTILNLKPRNMRGLKSAGMVICANPVGDLEKFQLCKIPSNAKAGDHVLCKQDLVVGAEIQRNPWEPNAIDKKGVWTDAVVKLRSNDEGVCCFDGNALVVRVGTSEEGGDEAQTLEEVRTDFKGAEMS